MRLLTEILTQHLICRLGAVNILVPMTTAAAIITYAWPLAKTKDALIAIGVLYGYLIDLLLSILPF